MILTMEQWGVAWLPSLMNKFSSWISQHFLTVHAPSCQREKGGGKRINTNQAYNISISLAPWNHLGRLPAVTSRKQCIG